MARNSLKCHNCGGAKRPSQNCQRAECKTRRREEETADFADSHEIDDITFYDDRAGEES